MKNYFSVGYDHFLGKIGILAKHKCKLLYPKLGGECFFISLFFRKKEVVIEKAAKTVFEGYGHF